MSKEAPDKSEDKTSTAEKLLRKIEALSARKEVDFSDAELSAMHSAVIRADRAEKKEEENKKGNKVALISTAIVIATGCAIHYIDEERILKKETRLYADQAGDCLKGITLAKEFSNADKAKQDSAKIIAGYVGEKCQTAIKTMETRVQKNDRKHTVAELEAIAPKEKLQHALAEATTIKLTGKSE